jgi:L-2-hydroxyglutarate oxidase LhgO
VNCGGLYADDIAHKMDAGKNYSIVPFRGEYFKLNDGHRPVLNSMLYPAPDLKYPFLGVHWTKKITGETWIGPNATMALGREAYGTLQIIGSDLLKMAAKKSFWKMFAKREFQRLAWTQLQVSLSKKRFVEEARRLISEVSPEDFTRARSGIRAQLVNNDGELIDDIVVEKKNNAVHVLNAVSPGFTCSLPFGRYLAEMLIS